MGGLIFFVSFIIIVFTTAKTRLHAEPIVGGDTAKKGQIKYIVSIQSDDEHVCGGAILDGQHIITAAHCVIDLKKNTFDNEEYTIVAGVINAHNEKEPHRVKAKVAKIYILREFDPIMELKNPRKPTADIAVLKLESDLGLNAFIAKVDLPSQVPTYPTYTNQQAVVCGYGDNWVKVCKNKKTNKLEVVESDSCYDLRFAKVNVVTNAACANSYRHIKESHLCGHMEQRPHIRPEGLCLGDSGSPLVIGNTIIGIMSFNPTTCREDSVPAVYARVTSFLPFIENAKNGVKAANMRLAKYEIKSNKRVLVEQ